MNSYEIPRNYKGEGRILYIFSTKALIYTIIGMLIGLIFYFILNALGLQFVGIIIDVIFGAIGFSIATFKIPDSKKFEFTRKTGGANIDEIFLRWVKFKKKKIEYISGKRRKQKMNENQISNILSICLMILVPIALILLLIFIILSVRERTKGKSKNKPVVATESKEVAQTKTGRDYSKLSIFSFMEFDKIEDNMIVRKNGNKFIMVIECQGINYDLMSGLEKIV